MLTVAPLSVLLMGVLGMAIVLASIARIVVLEHHDRALVLADPEPFERTPVPL